MAGRSRDIFGAIDGGARGGPRGNLQSCLGRSCEQMCAKLYVLITEL